MEETEPIKHVQDVVPAIVFQPINKDEIKLFQKNGGNALGIEADEGPLFRAYLILILRLRLYHGGANQNMIYSV